MGRKNKELPAPLNCFCDVDFKGSDAGLSWFIGWTRSNYGHARYRLIEYTQDNGIFRRVMVMYTLDIGKDQPEDCVFIDWLKKNDPQLVRDK